MVRASVDYLRELRERLPWPIAVEFRGGGWMEADRQSRTLKLLEDLRPAVQPDARLAVATAAEPVTYITGPPSTLAASARLARSTIRNVLARAAQAG